MFTESNDLYYEPFIINVGVVRCRNNVVPGYVPV